MNPALPLPDQQKEFSNILQNIIRIPMYRSLAHYPRAKGGFVLETLILLKMYF